MTALPVPVIAIDGPSGVGKGTACGHLSSRLGFKLLDSGSLYRLVGLACEWDGVSLDDDAGCTEVARALDASFEHANGRLRVWMNDREVSALIRTEKAGQDASKVAVNQGVRDALLDWQRHAARWPGLVADGRDMGTVVFPNAGLKIFLDASTEERARRRHQQLLDSGQSVTLAAVLEEMRERDVRDRTREAAPLEAAQDAKILDTSTLTLDAMLGQVDQWADEYLSNLGN